MSNTSPDALFEQLGGKRGTASESYFAPPVMDAKVYKTPAGVSYLTDPGVALFVRPQINVDALQGFLSGFDADLDFADYLEQDDDGLFDREAGAGVSKVAGQLCYMSFGPGSTPHKDVGKYLENIRAQRHGSVLEHPHYTFLVYGASRAFTHEAVRHRVGVAYSQVSQRYVDGKVLRFVERQEYQQDPWLHERFVLRIQDAYAEYAEIAEYLAKKQEGGDSLLSGEKKRDLRKKVNQCARSVLPNETEAPIIWTGNVRSLRHVFEMRAAGPADLEIRGVALRMFLCIRAIEPTQFSDYEVVKLPDGTHAVANVNQKV